jgi:hypothetical protein
MDEIFFIVTLAPEGGYTAQALGYPIFTEADTWADLKTQTQDAVACHFEQPPRLIRLHLVQEEIVPVCVSPVM